MDRRHFIKLLATIPVTAPFFAKLFSAGKTSLPASLSADVPLRSTHCYLALFSGTQEVSGEGYARLGINSQDFIYHLGRWENRKVLSFPAAKEDWGVITDVSFATDGMQFPENEDDRSVPIEKSELRNRLSCTQKVLKNDIVQFMPGDFSLGLS